MSGTMGAWANEFAKLAKFQKSGTAQKKEQEKGTEKQEEVQEKTRRLSSSFSEVTVCLLMDRFAPS
ncbi:hypothetical protein FCM35_KLT11440 [Carex littledalei]|uniref:Uncharacterized protein n=1 Tax=Carex littledalei TaxID=544730 RepID=A0A833QHZ9_9POAL|nr:hypothetical protein FCM35_KLT11440 [Carex littledalei]